MASIRTIWQKTRLRKTAILDTKAPTKALEAKESAMSNNEISKDLKNSNEDNYDVAGDYKSSGYKSLGYKSAQNKQPQKLNEDEPLMSGLLEDQIDNLHR